MHRLLCHPRNPHAYPLQHDRITITITYPDGTTETVDETDPDGGTLDIVDAARNVADRDAYLSTIGIGDPVRLVGAVEVDQ